jgi:hypothetical protein
MKLIGVMIAEVILFGLASVLTGVVLGTVASIAYDVFQYWQGV